MEERNENVMTYDATENAEVEAMYVEPEKVENKIDFGAIALGVVTVVGGVAAILHFTKEKREARKEAKLAEQGYVKLKPGEVIVKVEDKDSEDAVETEEEK